MPRHNQTKVVSFGYRSSEVKLPPAPSIKDNTRIKMSEYRVESITRPVVRSSLGCHVLGAANPHPDPSDLDTMLDGASRRFAREPPKPNKAKMERLRKFVRKWLENNMTPLSADTDTSFDTWINSTPYPFWKKEALRKVHEETHTEVTERTVCGMHGEKCVKVNKHCKVNSFQKDETYPTYKAARAINSRTDAFKVRVGPIFKLIEKELFAKEYFIKHTPVDMRAEEIKRELTQENSKIIGTDYTAYEALFTKEFMEIVEFQLYQYMTTEIEDQEWYKIVSHALSGENHCQFRNKFTMVVDATRMSGEMCTSLGNSFANLMSMMFIAEETRMENLRGRVEGDDGIFTFYGETPTAKDFAEIGLIIKIDEYDSLTEGSFCGIITDETEMINVTDPISSLLDFGWTTRQYADSRDHKKKKLLRSKALSLAYQYPGCPVLSALGKYGLRVTEGVGYDLGDMNEYEREIFRQMQQKHKSKIPDKEVGPQTRLLVQRKFGLMVEDQLIIENYLDNKLDISPIDVQVILSNCHIDALDYYSKYIFEYPIKEMMNQIECPIYDNYSHKKFELLNLNYEQTTTQSKSSPCYKKKSTSEKDANTTTSGGL